MVYLPVDTSFVDGGYVFLDQCSGEVLRERMAAREARPRFSDVIPETEEQDIAILADIEFRALGKGKLVKRNSQEEGSCVGVSQAYSGKLAQCADVVLNGESEEIVEVFPFATWGIGREKAGMNNRGAGSFGSANAWASTEWGWLLANSPHVPKPYEKENGYWLGWTAKQELDWSFPRKWAIQKDQLRDEAAASKHKQRLHISTKEEIKQAILYGRSPTLAGRFGNRGMKVIDGHLIAKWNSTWAHQQSIDGFKLHPSLGWLWKIQNQWPGAHPKCPFLFSTYGILGSYWITDEDMDSLLRDRDTDINVVWDTAGAPPKRLPWHLGLSV